MKKTDLHHLISISYEEPPFHAVAIQDVNQRDSMEDFVMLTSFKLDSGKPVFYCGLFDGHGNFFKAEDNGYSSAFVASFLAKHFHTQLQKELNCVKILKKKQIKKAIEDAFMAIDEKTKNYPLSGSCAIISLIIDNTLYVANLGDSKALLFSSNQCIALSRDARLSDLEYVQKILKKGGMIVNNRVNGSLNVAAAIGDWSLTNAKGDKCLVTIPEIFTYPLKKISGENDFLLMGSDGIWEKKITPEESLDIINADLQNHSIKHAAEELIRKSIESGSTDNLSVILVKCRQP